MRALAARLMHARAQGTSFGEIDRALGRTRERARQLAAFRACLVTYSPLITINVSSRRARAADEQPRAGDRRGDGPLARLRGVARARRLPPLRRRPVDPPEPSGRHPRLACAPVRRQGRGDVQACRPLQRPPADQDEPAPPRPREQEARGDRIAELEARLEEDLRRTRERTQELAERQRLIEEALRKAGIPLDGASLAVPERSRRRRAPGWSQGAPAGVVGSRGRPGPITGGPDADHRRSADDQPLTEEDLAESLCVSLRTVRRWRHDRTGPRVVRVMWAPPRSGEATWWHDPERVAAHPRPTVGAPGWPIALPACFVPYSLTITTNVSSRLREDS